MNDRLLLIPEQEVVITNPYTLEAAAVFTDDLVAKSTADNEIVQVKLLANGERGLELYRFLEFKISGVQLTFLPRRFNYSRSFVYDGYPRTMIVPVDLPDKIKGKVIAELELMDIGYHKIKELRYKLSNGNEEKYRYYLHHARFFDALVDNGYLTVIPEKSIVKFGDFYLDQLRFLESTAADSIISVKSKKHARKGSWLHVLELTLDRCNLNHNVRPAMFIKALEKSMYEIVTANTATEKFPFNIELKVVKHGQVYISRPVKLISDDTDAEYTTLKYRKKDRVYTLSVQDYLFVFRAPNGITSQMVSSAFSRAFFHFDVFKFVGDSGSVSVDITKKNEVKIGDLDIFDFE